MTARAKKEDDYACLALAAFYSSHPNYVHSSGKSGLEVGAIFSSQAASRGNAEAWSNLARYYFRVSEVTNPKESQQSLSNLNTQKANYCKRKAASLGDLYAKNAIANARQQHDTARIYQAAERAVNRRSLEADNQAYRLEEIRRGFISPSFSYEPVRLPPPVRVPVPELLKETTFSDSDIFLKF